MRRHLFVLSSLLLLTAGCRHVQSRAPVLPSLPASHARLSMLMSLYVRQLPEPVDPILPEVGPYLEPRRFEDLVQARAAYEQAVQVLRGEASAAEVSRAAEDLHIACRSELMEACDFLIKEHGAPRNITGSQPQYTNAAMEKRTFATVVIQCLLGPEGRFSNCKVLEGGPHGLTESVLAYSARARYQPATLAGHPLLVAYTLSLNFIPFRLDLSPEQKVQWARVRTERFPQSPVAWAHLANLLSKHAPGDPGLAEALRALDGLVPNYWWAANELAWLEVQAGRHAEAAPLVKRARSWEPNNSYVLETSAAVLAATGQCAQALVEQRKAVEKLPARWPAPERERFTRTLEAYQRQCPEAGAEPPRG